MARISNEELNESVYKPCANNDNEIQDKENRGVIAYTVLLNEVDEDDSSAYAKSVNSKGRMIYYVKLF